jgi:hypothetical protein
MFDQPPQRLSAKDMSVGPILSDLPHHDLFQKGCSELRTTILYNSQRSARATKDLVIKDAVSAVSAPTPQERTEAIHQAKRDVEMQASKEGKVRYGEAKQAAWEKFVLHDVQSTMTLISGTSMLCQAYREKYPSLYTEAIKSYEDKIIRFTEDNSNVNTKPLDHKIDKDYEGLITLYKDNRAALILPEGSDPYFSTLLKKTDDYIKVWPLLSSSSHLLNAIRQGNDKDILGRLKELQLMSVPLKDIFSLSTIKLRPEIIKIYDDVKVDGVTAIMVHNLLKNAQRYSSSYVDFSMGPQGITVTNDTRNAPDEKKLFHPEKPQVGGNTGYGLFTARKIFGPLGGKDIEYRNLSSNKTEPPYDVSFTIKPLDGSKINTSKDRIPLDTKKAYSEFKQNYMQVEEMKSTQSAEAKNQDWHKFIFHDVQTPATLYGHFVYGEDSKLLKSFFSRYNNAKDPRIKVLLLSQMNKQELHLNSNFPKEYLEGIQLKLEKFRKVFPLLRSSMDFLINPTEDGYYGLTQMKVPVQEIVDAFGSEMPQANFEGHEVNGIEGVIPLNFLKNASDNCPYIDEKEASKGRDRTGMRLRIDENGFSVINPSNNGSPGANKLFQLKGKGESGNTGFGMFTAAQLYAPLNESKVEAEWTDLPNENGPKYSVRFSLKKSPQSGNGSPLPQPVQ